MSRPCVARLAKVKRRASVPNAANAFREFLAGALFDAAGLLGVHQALGALGNQLVHRNAVDEIDRVEHIAFRLAHLLAFGIAHQAGDIDFAERYLAGEMLGHHHHACNPEEDDVEAGDEHRGRQVALRVPASARASPASRRATARSRTRCRARRCPASVRVRRPVCVLRLRSTRRRNCRRRHTRPGCDAPTTVAVTDTSPGCCRSH